MRSCVSDEATHTPPEQVREVTERHWLPSSPQVPSKPSQLLQLPVLVPPQLFPSVLRVQDCVSVLLVATHCPLAQL